jgi:1,4-alpha-glucan branching enzyme
MHLHDFSSDGFAWIDCNDAPQSTLSWLRRSPGPGQEVVIVCNFTPVPRHNYRVGVPREGVWRERLNSDARHYGGSNLGSLGELDATPVPQHGYPYSLNLLLPPLAIVFFSQGE